MSAEGIFSEQETRRLHRRIMAVAEGVGRVVIGKRGAVEAGLICLLARGHLLIEDVPGVGKTLLAKSLARALGLRCTRVQFTPDLLPADITGTSIFNPASGAFEFKPGPVFTDLLLADEINRATPRTQSSLLESMGENQVSIDGVTHPLSPIFFVIATQNPIDAHGTYPLPEAQLDRFMMKIDIGYPSAGQEVEILSAQIREEPLERLEAAIEPREVLEVRERVRRVHLSRSILAYIVEIAGRTREHPELLQGVSPRGALALMQSAQALAFLSGRDYVDPRHIKRLAVPVLAHRVILRPESRIAETTAQGVIEEIVAGVAVPTL